MLHGSSADIIPAIFFVAVGAVATIAAFVFYHRSKLLLLRAEMQAIAIERDRLRGEFLSSQSDCTMLRNEIEPLRVRTSTLSAQIEAQRESFTREQATQEKLREQLAGNFSQLSAAALEQNAKAFLNLANESLGRYQSAAKAELDHRHVSIDAVLKPVGEHINKLQQQVTEIEKQRNQAYGSLMTEVQNLQKAQTQLVTSAGSLRDETVRLSSSLRASSVRGRWGEMQLRNVVELAGMAEYCDFEEQTTITAHDGSLLRPDLLVRLPRGNTLVVDAKAPLSAYLNAVEAPNEEERKRYMEQHARQLRDHCMSLSQKAYWQQFHPTPEFVVMFLPGEMFFSAALQNDNELLQWSLERKIVLSTPTTLVALLRTVAQGWREAALERNALEVSRLGRELYDSLSAMGQHVAKLEKSLTQSVEHYNRFVGSLESRVVAKARKFKDLHIVSEDLPEFSIVEKSVRRVSRDELVAAPCPEPPQYSRNDEALRDLL